MKTCAKVFLIIGMCLTFYLILPIVFGVITIKKLDTVLIRGEIIPWGVLSIIFVSQVGGILVLCMSDDHFRENYRNYH